MPKVKTYLTDRYEAESNMMRRSTRRYTAEAIAASKVLQIVEETEEEIDSEDLISGEGWTPENYESKRKKRQSAGTGFIPRDRPTTEIQAAANPGGGEDVSYASAETA